MVVGKTLDVALPLLRQFEGLGDGDKRTPILEPYLCPAGFPTIGYGHLLGRDPSKLREFKAITREEAEDLLHEDAVKHLAYVTKMITVPLSNNQAAALLDFTFNFGSAALFRSQLRMRLNREEYDAVPEELMRWTKIRTTVVQGLVRRRAAECRLWLQPEERHPPH